MDTHLTSILQGFFLKNSPELWNALRRLRKNKLSERECAICDRLRLAREKLGLTQAEFARQIGLTRESLINYEYRKAPLKCGFALRLCRQFLINEKWLATGEGRFHQCHDMYSLPASTAISKGELFSAAYDSLLKHEIEMRLAWNPEFAFTLKPDPNTDKPELYKNALCSLFDYINELYPGMGAHFTYSRMAQAALSWLEEIRSDRYGQALTRAAHEAEATGKYSSDEDPEVFKRNLTTDAQSDPMRLVTIDRHHWEFLRERLKRATSERGRKAALAREFGVKPQAVNEWFSGASAPDAEKTLRLLAWVTAEEAKQQKSPQGALTPGEPKTQLKESKHETNKSGRKKK